MFIPNKSILFLVCLIGVFILNTNANPIHKHRRTRSTTVDDQSSTTTEDNNDDSTTTTESDIDENDLTTRESSEDLSTTLPNELTSIPSLISVSIPDSEDIEDVTIGPIVIDV